MVPGAYVLIIHVGETLDIEIGRQGSMFFPAGWYAYVGSAQGGLMQRVKRHLRRAKKVHWHIDYLLDKEEVHEVWLKQGAKELECEMSSLFSKDFVGMRGFGCSDCGCESHLFFGEHEGFESTLDAAGFVKCLPDVFI